MSNIRDLQKLKGTKNIHQMVQIHQRIINPQINCFNYQPLTSPLSIQHKILKNGLYHKQTFTANTSRTLHKRGGSFGTSQIPQRLTFNLIRNPRLSVYNFPLKIDNINQNSDGLLQSNNVALKSQRKIKNNYVSYKEQSSGKKSSTSHQSDIDVHSLITKASFTQLFPVGKGGFGKVWKVQMKKTKTIFAMKQMSKAKIIAKKSVTSVMNEQHFLSKLSHPFLVNMYYAFQNRQNLYLIMDYLDGGDLRYHLGNKQFFNQKQTKFFLSNIIISLQYLHRHKIIHRDLKPQNLVFDSQGFLKLTDLGISRQLRQDNHQDTSGTPGYMAPQVMLRKPHSFTADYFALGVIAYELMLGKRPYVGSNRKQIKQQILARQASVKMDQLPFKWSPYSLDFVNKLLLRNPEQRLGSNGIDQIKNHPWLQEIDWNKLTQLKLKPYYKPLVSINLSKSIEQDYQNYKEQISQDTLMDNEDQIQIMLRQHQTQQLFEGYHYQKINIDSNSKKKTSFPTNSTEENHKK